MEQNIGLENFTEKTKLKLMIFLVFNIIMVMGTK